MSILVTRPLPQGEELVSRLRALEFEPRTLQTAQQIASLVNLSRAALVHSDAIARVSLIKTMADQEGVRILPREPKDKYALLDWKRLTDLRMTAEELATLAGWMAPRHLRAPVRELQAG